MMKKTLLTVIAVFSLFLSSCSEKKEVKKITFKTDHPEQEYNLTNDETERVIEFLDIFNPNNHEGTPNYFDGCVGAVIVYYQDGETDSIIYYSSRDLISKNGILYEVDNFPLADIWQKYD